MKSKIVLIALVLFSAQASADWKLVSVYDDLKTYVDLSTKRIQGDKIFIWEMSDYSTVQNISGKKYKSTKELIIYKCNEMQRGIKTILAYSENLGSGFVVLEESSETYQVIFSDVVPGTQGEHLLRSTCGDS